MLGRVYIGGALVGGVGGLYLAQHSASGIVSDIGFGLLAVLTIATTAMAFKRILEGAVQSHREWMVRSYALILAAVTLRIYAPFLEAWLGEQDGYALVAWACWVPNLLVAEWLIRGSFRQRREPPRTVVRGTWDGIPSPIAHLEDTGWTITRRPDETGERGRVAQR